jgi:hypothetical protein
MLYLLWVGLGDVRVVVFEWKPSVAVGAEDGYFITNTRNTQIAQDIAKVDRTPIWCFLFAKLGLTIIPYSLSVVFNIVFIQSTSAFQACKP